MAKRQKKKNPAKTATEEKRSDLLAHFQIAWTPYIQGDPRINLKQLDFLMLDRFNIEEAFYGGAAGGGKSWAILACALQYVDRPEYGALILRRSYEDLKRRGALIQRSKEWMRGTQANYNNTDHIWSFPSGATLEFGYLRTESDLDQYQSAHYHFIGFDELTQFPEEYYTFMFSRLRRDQTSSIPLRMRGAGNPGGRGHKWVKDRFVDPKTRHPGCVFIPAKLEDNPILDKRYIQGLMKLSPLRRKQLLSGDWDASVSGELFQREWFKIIDEAPRNPIRSIRSWDLAASENPGNASRRAKTCGVKLMELHPNPSGIRWLIADFVSCQKRPGPRNQLILHTADMDSKSTRVLVEEEPGSGGIAQVDEIKRMLFRFRVDGIRPTGDKETRAGPASTQAELGSIGIVRAAWNREFLEAVESFPTSGRDETDAFTQAYNEMAGVSVSSGPIDIGGSAPSRFEGVKVR